MTRLEAENTQLLLTVEYNAFYARIVHDELRGRYSVVAKLPGNPELELRSVRQYERYINGGSCS